MARKPSLDGYLRELWDRKATDLLLTAGAPPLIRLDGEMQALDAPALTPEDTQALAAEALGPELIPQFEAHREVDFSFSWEKTARFRGNAFVQRGSAALALRLIPFAIPSFEDLGLPAVIEELVQRPSGLILVTGPTGSGKSTTLASMIDYINEHRQCHILTIEDPIEYVHHHKRSAVNQREVGVDSESFERALRSALREDPDVLLVGEMRDLESIQIALTIAETGHLVLATLHTTDTAQALDRIVDVFPAERQTQIRVQLANSLTGIVYQRLLPRVGGGLVAAFEVLVATPAIKNLIREGKSNQIRNVVATAQTQQMQTIEASLSRLVREGAITYDDAVARSLFPREIDKPAPVEADTADAGRRGRRGRR